MYFCIYISQKFSATTCVFNDFLQSYKHYVNSIGISE